MTHQAALHRQQTDERTSKTQIIESQRNTAAVRCVPSTFGVIVGLTVHDKALRKAQILLSIEDIDRLTEELRIARAYLEYEALLAELAPQS